MQKTTKSIEMTDEELLLLTKAVETEEAEEMSLRMGPDAHTKFVDLRGRLQSESRGLDWSEL